jgi:predicted nucleotidyltransferase
VQEKPPDFEILVRALIEAEARVVLIGGFAMMAHGSNTDTRDVDFAFARDKQTVHALKVALDPYKPRPRDFPLDLPFLWDEQSIWVSTLLTLQTTVGKIDLLAEIEGVGSFDELDRGALVVPMFGLPVKVASLQHLVAMKLAAGRPKDLIHSEELKRLIELKRSKS